MRAGGGRGGEEGNSKRMETEGERDREKEAAVLPLVRLGPAPIASGHSTGQFRCFSVVPLFWLAQMAGPLDHPSERYSTRVGAIFALPARMATPLESASCLGGHQHPTTSRQTL
jgi:hypothetical protein